MDKTTIEKKIDTVITALQYCLDNSYVDGGHDCRDCPYHDADSFCDSLKYDALKVLQYCKNNFALIRGAKEITSGQYFDEWRKQNNYVSKLEQKNAELKKQVDLLKASAYKVGYNDGYNAAPNQYVDDGWTYQGGS